MQARINCRLVRAASVQSVTLKRNEKQIEGRTETNFFSRERKEEPQVAVFF